MFPQLDEVEEKERLEEAAGAQTAGKKAIKLKPGASAARKVQKMAAETMPSPQGRRVEPKVPEETKMKVKRAIKAKENKGKRTVSNWCSLRFFL